MNIFQNKIIKTVLVVLPLLFITLGFYNRHSNESERYLIQGTLANLDHFHYSPKVVNDDFSAEVFDQYLKNIDFNKRFLLKEDQEALSQYRLSIDDESNNGTYNFFNLSIEILGERIQDAKAIYKEILASPFDYTIEETGDFSENIPYTNSLTELKERWRKSLKYAVMTRLASALDAQEKAQAKQDSGYVVQSFDSLEIKARKGVLKNHDDWFQRIERLNRNDRLATYINSITTVYDPHTNYYPPADKENFDIRMAGQLEGIGAQLQEKDGFIKVMKIIPGSPSAMQGDLKAKDLILKVAQGEGETVDIVNARIDDAVKLIRGKKGTEVRLTVQKPDGTIVVIPITRDVVKLEETYAKSLLIEDKDKVKTGYIYLPSFYADFGKKGGVTCSKDIKKELEKLKNAGATSLIFDVRNNGGGSLMDVAKIVGYFIKSGPVVQVKTKGRDPEVLEDHDNRIQWDKPVVVMVNEFSASASEILAAALQDYNRAVIVGSHSTHGKGTVQRFLGLNQTMRNVNLPDLGSIKLTMQKFYRIDGGATQLRGVIPDVILPDNYMYIKTGEKEHDFALEWDQIASAKYKEMASGKITAAVMNSQNRLKSSEIFSEIEANAKKWEKRNKMKVYSLNLDTYRDRQKAIKADNDEYKKLFGPIEDMTISFLGDDEEVFVNDTLRQVSYKQFAKKIKKDYYVYEALQIAEDLN
jgi:carboxyl-terminal processing protease